MKNVFAYIDGANLHKGIESSGWKLDYGRFRRWLTDKYGVSKAYLFMGLLPNKVRLYERLQDQGFELIFKQIAYDGAGKVKGNCDADLVLKVVSDHYEQHYDMAILITGDGDFSCLADFLIQKDQLRVILAPEHKKCSILLKKTGAKMTYLEEFKHRLQRK